MTEPFDVEVRNGVRLICQPRGQADRLPTEKERSINRRWAAIADLGVVSYI